MLSHEDAYLLGRHENHGYDIELEYLRRKSAGEDEDMLDTFDCSPGGGATWKRRLSARAHWRFRHNIVGIMAISADYRSWRRGFRCVTAGGITSSLHRCRRGLRSYYTPMLNR